MLKKTVPVLYHDGEIVVVNKPGGLLSVPGRGPEKQDCVSTRLQAQFSEMIRQPSVHRLDMSTSGLMVYAITASAHKNLCRQFANRITKKTYEAVVEGNIEGEGGVIKLSFRLDPDNRPYQIYDPLRGKPGITHWHNLGPCVLKNNETGTRIRFYPKTGRTHQLRLHSAHPQGLGSPIVGDSLYGNGAEGDKMFLHATELVFLHPATEKEMHFYSEPPF